MSSGGILRVLAARFREPRRAAAVLDVLQDKLHVAPPDVAIAPLGTPGQPSANDAVLAGRFPDEQARVVVELVRGAGGEMVANVDERWTKPAPARTLSRGKNHPWLRRPSPAS